MYVHIFEKKLIFRINFNCIKKFNLEKKEFKSCNTLFHIKYRKINNFTKKLKNIKKINK